MVLVMLKPQGFDKEHQLGNTFQYQTMCILHLTGLYYKVCLKTHFNGPS